MGTGKSVVLSWANSGGRRKGVSAPYCRATAAISPSSVETIVRVTGYADGRTSADIDHAVARRDASFGPIVMAGLGGVFIELFKDRSIRMAPVTMNEAEDMLRQLKAFPIKSHKWSTESNQALQSAIDLGRGWEFLLALYAKFDAFTPDRIPGLVIESGLDKAAFADASGRDATRDHLVASKKEGLRNGVDATPTFFLNGRAFLADLDAETVVDCLLEELEATGP